ncbi:hypothetical protein [Burkholderia sp. Leaf177]|uniref:hypothetical protein n=1 Tax=Burkholderia sp. Leaf177 TaxID=1736287 RepID=UPI000A6A7163|nr:hypothetical protein [Burkholderia sp. Leaf177]
MNGTCSEAARDGPAVPEVAVILFQPEAAGNHYPAEKRTLAIRLMAAIGLDQ